MHYYCNTIILRSKQEQLPRCVEREKVNGSSEINPSSFSMCTERQVTAFASTFNTSMDLSIFCETEWSHFLSVKDCQRMCE